MVAQSLTSMFTVRTDAVRTPHIVDIVNDFGAVSGTVATLAIQTAIDLVFSQGGGKVLIPNGEWLLTTSDYLSEEAGGAVVGIKGLLMRDGVELVGESRDRTILKLADGGGGGAGAFGRIITSNNVGRLTDAALRDFTIDGNDAGNVANTQFSNVLLESGSNVEVQNVRSRGSRGEAIMVRGTNTDVASNLRMNRLVIENSARIGLQVSHAIHFSVTDSDITDCVDNGIDIYGDAAVGTDPPTTELWTVEGNRIARCLTGIFPETSGFGTVAGNIVDDCTWGIHTNRINSAPRTDITANTVRGGTAGIWITGDNDFIAIKANTIFDPAEAFIKLGASPSISSIHMVGNVCNGDGTAPWLKIESTGTSASFITARSNTGRGALATQIIGATVAVDVEDLNFIPAGIAATAGSFTDPTALLLSFNIAHGLSLTDQLPSVTYWSDENGKVLPDEVYVDADNLTATFTVPLSATETINWRAT